MDDRDRMAIEDLFEKIARVERQSGPRDREAEAFIRSMIADHPGAPYYMAQTIVVQEQALNAAQRRIEDLEEEAGGRAGGGIFGGLFGSEPARRTERQAAGGRREIYEPWGASRGMGGGGFLAGAAQTAMGVAGGVLLGNMLADWLAPDAASAGEADAGGADQTDAAADDAGSDFGGDFDVGDF